MFRRAVRVAAIVASLGFGVLVSEALLHLVRPQVAYQYEPQDIAVSHFQASAYQPFELRPNHSAPFRMSEFATTVATNDLGLRDDPIDMTRERILCVGDSFTFGFGVEGPETFCARLQEAFGGKYDVVNAGWAGGNAPDTYALWIARHRDAITPRAIIVNLFQNDYTDVGSHAWLPPGVMPPERITEPGNIVTPEGEWMRDSRVARLPPLVRKLLKRSYVVAIIRDRWLQDAGAPPRPVVPARVAAAEEPAVLGDILPADARFLASLEMLRDAAAGTPLIIHVIPFKAQQTDARMDLLARQFAASHSFPFVQRYAAFTPDDYFAKDGHWMSSGHAKAAGYLHEALTGLGF